MKTEFVSEILTNQEINHLVNQLAEQERIASTGNTKETRKTAERKTDDIRNRLLIQNDLNPTAIYLYLKTTGKANSDLFRNAWQEKSIKDQLPSPNIESVEKQVSKELLSVSLPSLSEFPVGSFTIRIPFRLGSAYISKNDTDFYILDNPIQRDKTLQVPIIRSTSWKGALRASLWQSGFQENNPAIVRLFGSPRQEEENFSAGRLQFYTSFFTNTSLEIINPHDRKTKTGKNPIVIETVGKGAISTFALLYFPFDRIGDDGITTSIQSAADLGLVAKGLQDMLRTYGFGAKTSSGFGTAINRLPKSGELMIKLQLPNGSQPIITLDFGSLELMKKKAEALMRKIEELMEAQA